MPAPSAASGMASSPPGPTAGSTGTGGSGRTGTGDRGFGERVVGAVEARGSQLVLGLDPDPGVLWPRAREVADRLSGTPAERAAAAVTVHCQLVLEAVAGECVAAKLQVACFERLGAPGWAALAEVIERARQHGLLVIADAKRGDIDISAQAYAQAFFGETLTPFGTAHGLGVDALTASPFLGRDSIAPLVRAARARGAGVFVLVRTSNPGAQDIQGTEPTGGSVSEQVAGIVDELGADGGEEPVSASLADVGAVVGATAPRWLGRLRALMPRAVFLLPGVGAQGGRVEDLRPVFAAGPASGLISSSRGIVRAHESAGGDPAEAARAAAARLRELAWSIAG